jgi:hypothetical protein
VTRAVRLALTGLATVLVAGVVALPASPSEAAPSCPKLTVKQDVARADAVFRGVVKTVSSVHGTGKQRTRNYRVAADRVYQGSLVTKSVVVTVRTSAGGCGLLVDTLTKGRRYIFFADERGTQLVAASATAPAKAPLTSKVVKLLGNGKQPQKTPPVTPQFTKVADANPPRLSRLLAPGAALVIVALLGLLVVGRLGRRTS